MISSTHYAYPATTHAKLAQTQQPALAATPPTIANPTQTTINANVQSDTTMMATTTKSVMHANLHVYNVQMLLNVQHVIQLH